MRARRSHDPLERARCSPSTCADTRGTTRARTLHEVLPVFVGEWRLSSACDWPILSSFASLSLFLRLSLSRSAPPRPILDCLPSSVHCAPPAPFLLSSIHCAPPAPFLLSSVHCAPPFPAFSLPSIAHPLPRPFSFHPFHPPSSSLPPVLTAGLCRWSARSQSASCAQSPACTAAPLPLAAYCARHILLDHAQVCLRACACVCVRI